MDQSLRHIATKIHAQVLAATSQINESNAAQAFGNVSEHDIKGL